MKKVLVVLAAVFVTAVMYATPAWAQSPSSGSCPAGGTQIGGATGSFTTGDGVTISWNSTTVTVTGGSADICVKAGNSNSGHVLLDDGESYTVDFENNGGQFPAISHVELYSSTQTTTTTTTTTTGGPTSTTTAGPTTSTTTAGPTTSTTSGGPTSTTTAGPTTGSGGVLGGSTTGGTTGGTAPSGGNLPFTGLPIWVPLLAAASLLASGIVLIRRRKGEIS
jgi:hypothetical protein